jgi:hypothetical protein
MQILELEIGGRVRDKRNKKVLEEEGRAINSQECISCEKGEKGKISQL